MNALITIPVCLAACGPGAGTGMGANDSLPPRDDRGDFVSSAEPTGPSGPKMAWTPDGTEIVYFNPGLPPLGSSGISAVNITTKAVRSLATPGHLPAVLRMTPDARWVYVSLLRGTNPSPPPSGIYRLPLTGGPFDTIASASGSFALSTDGSALAYLADALYLVRIADRSRQPVASAQQAVIAFSPDATEIALLTFTGGIIVARAADGVSRTVWAPGSSNEVAGGVRWEQGVVQVLYRKDARFFIRSARADSSVDRQIGQLPGDPSGADFGWSPDGARVAAWTLLGTSQHVLYLLELASGATTRRAQVINDYPSSLAFSPDGRLIAYIVGKALYVVTANATL